MKCLVTGASGFVAEGLLSRLAKEQYSVGVATRSPDDLTSNVEQVFEVERVDQHTSWKNAVTGQEVVIHLANRAHITLELENDALEQYREVNVRGTINLAHQALAAGVKRFIFISSIKVNGEQTFEKAYQHNDVVEPKDAYAVSKWEAELSLTELCLDSNMELVIIRPPLVYGPKVKGNLRRLKNAIDAGLPLPLVNIKNQRDLISLKNLVDLIAVCVTNPNAAGQTFLCSDSQPVSTKELVEMVAQSIDRKPKLFWLPSFFLTMVFWCIGKQDVHRRLFGDLRVDIAHTRDVLGWTPPFTFEECIVESFSESAEDVQINSG